MHGTTGTVEAFIFAAERIQAIAGCWRLLA
jgi:hypothetical protein